ncbi:hypothetical protein HED60_02925 [Planctomycetales bacterium ZRK34]|nr:hypothetical protein HED60_02925 [Planctomycetales bacterium ZRK34]
MSDRLVELTLLYRDGVIDPAALDELQSSLRSDATARDRFVELLYHGRLIHRLHAPGRVQTESQPPSPMTRRRRVVGVYSGVALAAAALIALALTAWFVLSPAPQAPTPVPSPRSSHAIAMFSDCSADAVFADAARAPQLGQSLEPGSIRLVAGKAQLMFRTGAVVDLIGPCDFEMTQANAGVLHHGRLEAFVPGAAHGFTVRGPDFSVIDRGTAFTLRIDPDRNAYVQVTEGRVIIQPNDGSPAYDLAASESISFAAEARRYLRHNAAEPSQPLALPTGYAAMIRDASPTAYWPVPDTETFERVPDLPALPGAGQSLRAREPIALSGSYTLECWLWLNAPRRSTILGLGVGSSADDIISHTLLLETLAADELDMRFPAQGNVLRDLHRSRGVPDVNSLSDRTYAVRRWQHVAVTFDGAHVRVYLDGRLTAESSADHPLAGPAYLIIGSLAQHNIPPDRQRLLDGFVRQLAVYDRALPAGVIAEHAGDTHTPTAPTKTEKTP